MVRPPGEINVSCHRFDGNPLCSLPANAPVCTGPPLPPLGFLPGAGPGFGAPDVPTAGPGGIPNSPAAVRSPSLHNIQEDSLERLVAQRIFRIISLTG